MSAEATHRAIEAVWRIESARIVASVARMVRDIGVAEELAQDALIAALEHWPRDGVPDNPGAWLMTVQARSSEASAAYPQLCDRGEDYVELRKAWTDANRGLGALGLKLRVRGAPIIHTRARS